MPLALHVSTRRQFIGTSAAVAAAVAAGWEQVLAEEADRDRERKKNARPINVGVVGTGGQGMSLMDMAMRVPGVAVKALCDIWPYHRNQAVDHVRKQQGAEPRTYDDYAKFLNDAKGLEAVFVAVPEWKHAEISSACLRAGLHVYSEKEMANTPDECRAMIRARDEAKKTLQIGHHYRSNPVYQLVHKLLYKDKFCGRITHVRANWNRNTDNRRAIPPEVVFDPAPWGYESMERFRNWRMYRKFCGGWMALLGSHQLDVMNWMLGGPPSAVYASGGIDYWRDEKGPDGKPLPPREWFDNILCTYEYPDRRIPGATIRLQYQILTSNQYEDCYEVFMGDQGTILVNANKGLLFREPRAKRLEWEHDADKADVQGKQAIALKIGASLNVAHLPKDDPAAQELEQQSKKPPHQLAVENFFDAINTGGTPPSTGEHGLAATVASLTANRSADEKRRIEFKAEEFVLQ